MVGNEETEMRNNLISSAKVRQRFSNLSENKNQHSFFSPALLCSAVLWDPSAPGPDRDDPSVGYTHVP